MMVSLPDTLGFASLHSTPTCAGMHFRQARSTMYVRQHPDDAQLSVEELRDMVGHEGEAFSNCVLHYASPWVEHASVGSNNGADSYSVVH